MSIRDFNAQRLFVEPTLAAGTGIVCNPDQYNYLKNVLRLRRGNRILVFNGRDGEWLGQITALEPREVHLEVVEQTRNQAPGPDIDYLFAPLKRARLDYMVQKATEMGVARLRTVLTRRTTPTRVNLERMRANAVEAAEQCGILYVPKIAEPVTLQHAIANWDAARQLVFCDEAAPRDGPIDRLKAVKRGPLAVLIGPEGGFDAEERSLLAAKPFVTAIALGPRIMRADTAGVAALALVNAVCGDWR